MIGQVPLEGVREHAEVLAALGGPEVPPESAGLTEFAVSGPTEIFTATRAAAERGGSVLMSSGGTTGKPKLTHLPHAMGLDRLTRSWRPLGPGNVMLNLFNAGRMWGSHYYMQALAEKCRCTVIPSGPYPVDEVERWLPMFKELGLDALAGTPTGLADFAEGVLAVGETLPVKVIIWMGEPWIGSKRELVRQAFPEAGLWGNYGSVETWVMGTNSPGCDETVLHLLPDQVIEPDEKGALLTRAGDGWTVPTIRYRLGDNVESARCRCGRPDGLRVTGRADDAVSLRSGLFRVSELLEIAREEPGVDDAQLVLTRSNDSARAASAFTLEFTGEAEPGAVIDRLFREFYQLAAVERGYPGSIAAQRVTALNRIDRTNKVPAAVWKEA